MRRYFNPRPLLILLGVIAVVAGSLHLLHLYQVDRNVASLLDYARQAKAEKKPQDALKHYLTYLKNRPNDLDAKTEYALAYDEVAVGIEQKSMAIKLLEEVLLKPSASPKAREVLIDNLVFVRRYDAAIRHIEALMPIGEDKAFLERKLGLCLDAQGKPEPGAKALRRSIDLNPKHVPSYTLLAEILHSRLNREDEALETLDLMVDNNPASHEAYLARFHYHRLMGRDGDATADLIKAREFGRDKPEVLLAASQWAQANRNFEQARRFLEEGRKISDLDEALIRETANLELRLGKRDEAMRIAEQGLKDLKDKNIPTATLDLQIFLADLLIDAGRKAEAKDLVVKLRELGLRSELGQFFEARLLADEKKYAEAIVLLDKTKIRVGTDPFWNTRVNALLGFCHGGLGDTERQIGALLDAARTDANWTELNLSLGQAYLTDGNIEAALSYLQRVVQDPAAPASAKILHARALVRETLQTPEKSRRWKEVDAALERAKRAGATTIDCALLKSEVLLAQRKTADARAALIAEVATSRELPKSQRIPLFVALAELEAGEPGGIAKALVQLDEAGKQLGESVDLRVARIRALTRRGDAEDVEQLKALGEKLDAFSAEEKGQLHRELGEAWMRLGEPAAADAAWSRAAVLQPRDLRCRIALFDLALQERRMDAAREWLSQIKNEEGPRDRQAAYGELLLRVDEAANDPDALVKLLDQLKTHPLRKDPARFCLVEARVFEHLGRTEEVVDRLQASVEKGQRSPRVLSRLILQLIDLRRYDRAGETLGVLEAQGPLPRDMLRPAVEIALANREPGRIRGLLGPIAIAGVNDHGELLWLAQTYQAIGDAKNAEAAIRRAVVAAPHAPETWTAAVRYFVRTDQRREADCFLAEIPEQVPYQRLCHTFARCFEAMGNVVEAEKWYDAALRERPEDFATRLQAADFHRLADQPSRAEPLYQKLLEEKTQPIPADLAARARRGLALVWSKTKPEQAMKLMEGSPSRNEVSEARVRYYLEGINGKTRPEAIKKFETSLLGAPASDESLFQLAQLNDMAGNADRYNALVRQLLDGGYDTPSLLAYHARVLLRRRDVGSADAMLKLFLRREPDTKRADDLSKAVADAAARKK